MRGNPMYNKTVWNKPKLFAQNTKKNKIQQICKIKQTSLTSGVSMKSW